MNSIDDPHGVSTFTLDVYFANDRAGDRDISLHVETCERCRDYLAELEVSSRVAPKEWPRLRDARAALRPRRSPQRIAVASLAAVALAAGVALFASSMRDDPGSYVASKGAPATQAVIRSGGRTRIWDGKSPIRVGDAIALRAGCEGFTHITVVAVGPWSRLFDGACPSGGDLLPFTLIADDTPGEERIAVVFSAARPDDDALRTAARRHDRTSKAWVVDFVFPKLVQNP